MKKFSVLLLINIMVCFLLTGCWSYIGLDEITIVSGMTIDIEQKSRDFIINFEVIDTSKSSKEGGLKTSIIESRGPTIFAAIRSTKRKLSKKLYFGDCKVLIISNKVAKEEGVKEIVNFFLRDHEPREIMSVFISKGEQAKEIFTADRVNSNLISQTLFEISQESEKLTEARFNNRLYQINNYFEDDKQAFLIPVVELKKEGDKKIVEISGTGIIQNSKFIDLLDVNESKFLLFANNKISRGLLACDLNNNGLSDSSFEIDKSDTSRKIENNNGQIKVKIHVKTAVALGELQTGIDTTSLKEIEKIESILSAYMKKEIEKVVKDSQEKYKSDYLRIGDTIYKKDVKLWKQISGGWDKMYPTIKIEVDCKTKVLSTGKIK